MDLRQERGLSLKMWPIVRGVATGCPAEEGRMSEEKIYWSEASDCEHWHGLGLGCPLWLWKASPHWLKLFWLKIMEWNQHKCQ